MKINPGSPNDADIGRIFGFGYLGNPDEPVSLNRYLHMVHQVRAGLFEGEASVLQQLPARHEEELFARSDVPGVGSSRRASGPSDDVYLKWVDDDVLRTVKAESDAGAQGVMKG